LLFPVETGVFTRAVPSTLGPISHWFIEIKQPDVKIDFIVGNPIQQSKLFDIIALFLVHEVSSLLLSKVCFPNRLKSCSCSSVAFKKNIIWVVDVSRVRYDAWFTCEAEQSGRLKTIIIHNVKVATKCRKKLEDAD